MRDDICFGEKLRRLREERKLTLRELSARSGIHTSTISRLETECHRRPHMETFIQLARGFGISIQELAVLTDMIEPEDEEIFVIKDDFVRANLRLLNKQNLSLLKALEGTDSITRYHLIQLVEGLQREDGSEEI